MPRRVPLCAAALIVSLAGCGRDRSFPTSPSTTDHTPRGPDDAAAPGGAFTRSLLESLSVVVFYDENGNGAPDPPEAVRLPNVAVLTAGQTARTLPGTGEATITNVPAGFQTVSIAADSLPSFYVPPPPITVEVPRVGRLMLPVTLPIGANRPNTYMAFGDSITVGEGSSDLTGYRGWLEAGLQAHFGSARVIDQGVSATRSDRGASRIRESLEATRPAYTLVHYGTNDWNNTACRLEFSFPCFTIDSLRSMVREAKAQRSLPFLATIIPVNAGYDDRVPAQRNDWVAATNRLVRLAAQDEGAVLVDLEAAFLRAVDLRRLFSDHVHPNDAGYQIMADTFLEAITRARAGSLPSLSTQGPPVLGFGRPGAPATSGPASGGDRP